MGSNAQRIALDFSQCPHFGAIHLQIKEKFSFADTYGRSLESLREYLYNDYVDKYVHVEINHVESLSGAKKAYLKDMLKIFDALQLQNPHFTYQIT